MNIEEYKNNLESFTSIHDWDKIEIFYDVSMEDTLAPEDITIYIIEFNGVDIIDEFTAEEIKEFKKEIFYSGEREAMLFY